MNPFDWFRKLWSLAHVNLTYRRYAIVFILIFLFLRYFGPSMTQWISGSAPSNEGEDEQCLSNSLAQFSADSEEFSANIRHYPAKDDEKPYLAFVGNGVFGLTVDPASPVYIKSGRTLSLPAYWFPIVSVTSQAEAAYEATVVHYTTGIVHRIQCLPQGTSVSHQYYAHRTLPNVFVQEITINNPTNDIQSFSLRQGTYLNWPTAVSHVEPFSNGKESFRFQVVTGMVEVSSKTANVMGVSIVSKSIPQTVEMKARSTKTIQCLTVIKYSEAITKVEYATRKDILEKEALNIMERAVVKPDLKDDHVNVWKQLWSTGVTISQSKHTQAINGDKINATFYYVLSHVASPYHEDGTSKEKKAELMNSLFYAEGCFGGHHTLQANNLWQGLSSIEEVNTAVSYWLLTLEKQGCHNLLKAGAPGVMQAMVLSIGGLRFSNQHLELNMHPSDIHREYVFRRISYGNLTHVNISVEIQDNKPVLYVALDRSDKYYYGCDAGCLDPPVLLRSEKTKFQVKLTEPLTAILYITYDKQHMEDLRHAIHVKNVEEAPPLHSHIISLHKHGHHLGFSTMFWVFIALGITTFHIFVFRLIYNELFHRNDKLPQRTRYTGDLNNMHRL
ncbi:uncharacterized protein KIAA2013 homolog [Schistocerca gregaria]|uniref:uncharacterized protein KIAA2013 homolog n=1 Tax=Schistocerca gregaria TaxID=7010 RepID=UPI00211E4D80|nr:uncharacterized protein KIAA2013 homolog [Schistocerca gregaria]